MLADGSPSIVFWSIVLLVIVIAGLAVALQVKRRLTDSDDPADGPGFTLSDLRQLHKQGKMTTEEFERAKIHLLGAARGPGAAGGDAPASPSPERPTGFNK